MTARPPGSSADLTASDAARPTLVPDLPGRYELTLVVSDGVLESTPDVVGVDAVSTGRFVPAFAGTGVLDDFATGERIHLPPERRIHVWLMAEGYTQADLDAGRFDADVERWWNELRAVDVYAAFADVFVVWKLPVPSAEHVARLPARADTAFRVPIAASGAAIDDSVRSDPETAARVWSYMAEFPFPPSYYPATPARARTRNMAKGLQAVLLVFNPDSPNGGWSGRGAAFTDPASERRIGAAIAQDTTHEFTHVLAHVGDEYMRGNNVLFDNTTMTSSAFVGNIAAQPTCDTLPWKHLLDGSEINPSDAGLVGAFGGPDAGYHAELECLMNGTPGNAEFFGREAPENLRPSDARMCNFCRELTAFRILEKTRILDDPETSWTIWAEKYRRPFFAKLGFSVPDRVPQTLSDGTPVYMACTP